MDRDIVVVTAREPGRVTMDLVPTWAPAAVATVGGEDKVKVVLQEARLTAMSIAHKRWEVVEVTTIIAVLLPVVLEAEPSTWSLVTH
jgi:hypothetical protein